MDYAKQFLNKKVKIKIDRPMGSKHPKHKIYYPVNYGYVEGVMAPDGEELDAYLLGVYEPVQEFEGECLAIIHRTDDNDDKLIIVPESVKYSNEQIKVLIEFQERFFKSKIIK